MENDVLYNRIMNVIHKEYGEGSTAVANPEGEPTDSLETIQIGDDVYSISSGGGGTGGTMIVTEQMVGEDVVLNKTYAEIKTALESGIFPYMLTQGDQTTISVMLVGYYGFNPLAEKYAVDFSGNLFLADTEDGVLTQHI